ncbi:uncharacterized protein LOC116434457 [Nomia melanderi]|uniref:uncharacterized protein LOC116434457 n=1 Tax=Nomia melanderi TaxID=2448451 RepID=UPI003FCDF819
METSMADLLMFVLCVASWSSVKAENTVTITGYSVDITNSDVIKSWNTDVSDNVLASTININQDCPGSVQAEIAIYKEGNLVNTVSQTYKQPFKEFQGSNICGSIDGPEPDDESCSAVQGEQVASECDVRSWFSDMDVGSYDADCDFQIEGNSIAVAHLNVKVESA